MRHPTMGNRRWLRWFCGGVAVVAALIVLAFVVISWQIGTDVRAASDLAVAEYGGDRVTALMAYADSPSHTLRGRNRAIWALGHLGDRRALPVLEKYYTGQPCDHSQALCQYELEKAMRLCRSGTNLPALVWRRGSRRE